MRDRHLNFHDVRDNLVAEPRTHTRRSATDTDPNPPSQVCCVEPAIQAIEHLSVLFAALAARPIGPLVVHDPASPTTVAVPTRSFAEHLALGVGLIRRFGAKEPTVVHALLRLLSTVLRTCRDEPERWTALQHQAELLVTAAEREAKEPADLASVYAEANALRQALATRRSAASSAAQPTPNSSPRHRPQPDRVRCTLGELSKRRRPTLPRPRPPSARSVFALREPPRTFRTKAQPGPAVNPGMTKRS